MGEWIILDGAWTQGYNALTVPCPRCGDDAIFHLGVSHGEVTATLAERPCGCRLTAKQLLGLWDAGERASERAKVAA